MADEEKNDRPEVDDAQQPQPPSEQPGDVAPAGSEGTVGQDDIDSLLKKAGQETPAAKKAVEKNTGADKIKPFEMKTFGAGSSEGSQSSIDLIKDVNLSVRVELGRRKMYIEDILKLNSGSVVELEKLAGDPLDIMVNDRLVARGEVLILNDNFCIRVTETIKQVE
jgi:flagellar motor switch protein FliN